MDWINVFYYSFLYGYLPCVVVVLSFAGYLWLFDPGLGDEAGPIAALIAGYGLVPVLNISITLYLIWMFIDDYYHTWKYNNDSNTRP